MKFLMTNKAGSFLFLGDKPDSRFQGFFVQQDELCKTINNISILNDKKTKKSFFVPLALNSFAVETEKECDLNVSLDVRKIFDMKDFGRFHEITREGNNLVIKFTKKTNVDEDDSDDALEFEIYIAIASEHLSFDEISEWTKEEYSFDRKRNSLPFERYVFVPCILKGKVFAFGVDKDKEKAAQQAIYTLQNLEKLKQEKQDYEKKLLEGLDFEKIKDKKIREAFRQSLLAFDSMVHDGKIAAGYPWFFEDWARDELISAGVLIRFNRADIVKKILLRRLSEVDENAKLKTKPNSGHYSADALGWLFKRFYDLRDRLDDDEKTLLLNKTKAILDTLIRFQTNESFALNGDKETWMDSIERSGARIEMQAMRLLLYRFVQELYPPHANFYRGLEKSTLNKVRASFFDGKILADGLDDKTIRPNIFIAYYIYPDILEQKEWETAFNISIKKLWLKWGGFSTIDKKDSRFENIHTGENPKSYHNGDSWYWINNLAALCMVRLNKDKYKNYINRILKASATEILEMGIENYHAELSSAKEQTSDGCPAQTWSSAMFIELVLEMYYK